METERAKRLANFVSWVGANIKGDEKGEAQVFLDRFFQASGHAGLKEAGATLEERIKKGPGKGISFADLVWKLNEPGPSRRDVSARATRLRSLPQSRDAPPEQRKLSGSRSDKRRRPEHRPRTSCGFAARKEDCPSQPGDWDNTLSRPHCGGDLSGSRS